MFMPDDKIIYVLDMCKGTKDLLEDDVQDEKQRRQVLLRRYKGH
jgi:hypothetical protein